EPWREPIAWQHEEDLADESSCKPDGHGQLVTGGALRRRGERERQQQRSRQRLENVDLPARPAACRAHINSGRYNDQQRYNLLSSAQHDRCNRFYLRIWEAFNLRKGNVHDEFASEEIFELCLGSGTDPIVGAMHRTGARRKCAEGPRTRITCRAASESSLDVFGAARGSGPARAGISGTRDREGRAD